jgi:hypothetical protein
LDTVTALSSESWLGISLESVQEFLHMDNIGTVEEINLVRALIKWGKFQVKKDGDQCDGDKVRTKILPGLNLIRFSTLTTKEFASLCLEELGSVLSAEEKHSIMMAIVTEDFTLMPPDVVINNYPARKREENIVCKLPYEATNVLRMHIINRQLFNKFQLRLPKKANFQGFMLKRPQNKKDIFTFELKNYETKEILWKGSSDKGPSSYEGEDFYKICPALSLDGAIRYILQISNPFVEKIETYQTQISQRFDLTSDNGSTFGWVWSLQGYSIVEALVFEKSLL